MGQQHRSACRVSHVGRCKLLFRFVVLIFWVEILKFSCGFATCLDEFRCLQASSTLLGICLGSK